MRSFLIRLLKTAFKPQLFLVVWSLAAVVSALMFFNVLSNQRIVYMSIATICYPVLIVAVLLDLEIWHNRQVISAAITRGRSRLEIVCKPFFYLVLSHIVFYAGVSILFLPDRISNLAILQLTLTQASLTAWLIYISVATDKRIVAATVVLIYLYIVSPFLVILESTPEIEQFDVIRSWPAFIRVMISKITYVLPPLWSVGGLVFSGNLIPVELLGKCFSSTLLPIMAAYRLLKAKDI